MPRYWVNRRRKGWKESVGLCFVEAISPEAALLEFFVMGMTGDLRDRQRALAELKLTCTDDDKRAWTEPNWEGDIYTAEAA